MTQTRTNVVIITYNALPYTMATLDSLFAHTDNDYTLTIVDNGSDPDTIGYLDSLTVPTHCRKLTLIKNGYNAGVGHAYNQGQQVSFSDSLEFTAFCNNDLYFSHGWLRKLEENMSKNPNVAMLSPLRPSAKVSYDGNISTRDRLLELPETDDWRQELEGYTKRPINEFDGFCNYVIKTNGATALEFISFPDSLSTCVCLTRNEHFSGIGKFADPIFTGYGGEDIDMSWTIMKAGFDCAVDHSVYVHHFRGKSLRANSLKRAQLLKKSNKILYDKWRSSIQSLLKEQRDSGVDIVKLITCGQNSNFWLLHELNKDENFIQELVNE
ncbi:MAG: glycosyltransferase [Candidatus Saccharimonas sp.]